MARALQNGEVVAESDDVRMVEGMVEFPISSVHDGALVESATTSRCFWKGKARSWHVAAGDEIAPDAAFADERPWPLARKLVSDRIAFWRGVTVER
jgi:uncharacterized protein (DUF427 family)